MRKIRNLVIGGIQTKVIVLILVAMILTGAVFTLMSQYKSHILTELSRETNRQQQQAISDTTNGIMRQVAADSMTRIMGQDARIADETFRDQKILVHMIADYAAGLMNYDEELPPVPLAEPDPARQGQLSAFVLYDSDAEAADENVRAAAGRLANMMNMMLSACEAYGTDNAYISTQEGFTLLVTNVSGNWRQADGTVRRFPARSRFWYREAAEKGTCTFSDVEQDLGTGDLCITCSMPVYSTEGELLAVVGSDIFLDGMQKTVAEAENSGGFLLVVNKKGHVVLAGKDSGFEATLSDRATDLRASGNTALSALVEDALEAPTDVRPVDLPDGRYYMTGVPLETVGWTMISAYREELVLEPAKNMEDQYATIAAGAAAAYNGRSLRARRFIIGGLAVLSVIMLVAAALVSKRIVQPLNTITRRIAGLSETNSEFRMEDAYRTGDEIEVLAESFASISHRTVQYVGEVKRVTAENERIGTELDLARRIQADVLPNIFPPFPERTDMNIYASMDPAKEVGGDFYDFFLLDEDHLGLVVADVSGKGVPAALFMMVSKILVQNFAQNGGSPREVLEKVNQQICQNNREEMFVTLWLGILDLKTGRMTASNAGHEYPIVRQPDSGFEIVKDRHGFVIGGLNGVKYTDYELTLEKGAKFFIYTDGVPEATNAENELFGMDRLLAALNEARDGDPQQIIGHVRQEMDVFVGSAPQFDDITMLCFEYIGPRTPLREITMPAAIESIPAVTDFVNAELEKLECPMKAQMQIDVAVDELFSNIARYAYGAGSGDATVRVEPTENPRGVQVTFIDSGISYNPLEAPEPDVTLSADKRQVGGLGIFVVRKTMSSVTYESVDRRNILRIRKDF